MTERPKEHVEGSANNNLNEATGPSAKIDTLIRAGLGSTGDMNRLRAAISDPRKAVQSVQLREFVSEAAEKIFSVVLNDSTAFNRVKSLLSSGRSLSEAAFEALEEKADESGFPFSTLLEVYNRGYSAHDVSDTKLTAEQAAFNRVNGFIAGSKAVLEQDGDLIEEKETAEVPVILAPIVEKTAAGKAISQIVRSKVVAPIQEAKGKAGLVMSAVQTKKKLDEEILNEKKRGRPSKNPSPAGEEGSEADKHVIMQLRKTVSLRGSKPVEFQNGDKAHVDPRHAHALLKQHDALSKPDEKQSFASKIGKSHKDFLGALGQKS